MPEATTALSTAGHFFNLLGVKNGTLRELSSSSFLSVRKWRGMRAGRHSASGGFKHQTGDRDYGRIARSTGSAAPSHTGSAAPSHMGSAAPSHRAQLRRRRAIPHRSARGSMIGLRARGPPHPPHLKNTRPASRQARCPCSLARSSGRRRHATRRAASCGQSKRPPPSSRLQTGRSHSRSRGRSWVGRRCP